MVAISFTLQEHRHADHMCIGIPAWHHTNEQVLPLVHSMALHLNYFDPVMQVTPFQDLTASEGCTSPLSAGAHGSEKDTDVVLHGARQSK